VPHYWIVFATPESIHDKLQAGDWTGARDEIEEYLRGEELEPEDVYFDPEAREAYVLGHTEAEGPPTFSAMRIVEVFKAEELTPPESGESA
jgi:hypothetical protein